MKLWLGPQGRPPQKETSACTNAAGAEGSRKHTPSELERGGPDRRRDTAQPKHHRACGP